MKGPAPVPDKIKAIAARLNLHRFGREWRGRCPACGYGSGAFSVTIGTHGKLLFWCAACQDRAALAATLEAAGAGQLPARHDDDGAEAHRAAEAKRKARDAAATIWNGSVPARHDDPAGRYLASRRLEIAIGNSALRYRRDTPHPDRRRYDALICRVDGVQGELIAIHRIYVRPDGTKANTMPSKAAKGPIWGGAIRFGTGPEVVIAEGPETALAAGILLNLPSWSAIAAGNLAKGLVLPPDVRSVVIAADHDKPGIEAAQDACRRWRREGRAVRLVLPHGEGSDFADLLADLMNKRGAQ